MGMKILRYSAVVLALSLVSCEKELDFEYRDIDPILVIEASLTQSGARASLTETTSMDEPMNRERLTDATVILTDLTAGISAELLPGERGEYENTVSGEPGHLYRLDVTRGDISYTSQCLMSEPVEMLGVEFGWIKMPYDHVAVLKVSFTDPQTTAGDCYWVRVYRNGEAYMWTEVTDNLASGGVIEEVMMTSRMDTSEEEDDTVLRDGDVVTATVTPISREMYDYLTALSADSNGPSMFSGGFCLGYFLAAPVATGSVTFCPDNIPYY